MNNVKQKNILLVEDEFLTARMEIIDLELEGYHVIHAASGEIAVDILCVKNEPVDLILMDIDLGDGIDGTEAAQRILKCRSIPVVFLSSHTEKDVVDKTEKITSYGYVVKNSSFTVLSASIKMAFKLHESNRILSEKNESLHHHSQLLESIMENFPGFVLWKDTSSKIMGCSSNFARRCGFSSQVEVIGKSDYDLPFHDYEVDSFLEDDRNVMQTKLPKMHFEEREHVANGEEIFLDTCKFPLFDIEGNVNGILAVAFDITERKRYEESLCKNNIELMEKNAALAAVAKELNATISEMEAVNEELVKSQRELLEHEAALKESETRFKALHNASFGGIAIHDKGLILDCNQGLSEMTGYQVSELIGMNGLMLISEKTRSSVIKNIESGYEKPYEAIGIRKNGEEFPIRLEARNVPYKGKLVRTVEFRDITDIKNAEEELKQYEWIMDKIEASSTNEYQSIYGDLTSLNTRRLILDGVGRDNLSAMAEDVMTLLDTSLAVYESNGDYAYGVFNSSWCKLMDSASFKLCETDDAQTALKCGKWLCHENCWNDSAKAAILSGKPTDIECVGGINLYAVPIFADNEIIGIVNIGYGNPPKDYQTLEKLSVKYNISIDKLNENTQVYKTRPNFIIELGKKRCRFMAQFIGEIIERKRSMEKINALLFEKTIILKEIHHRIKNNMYMIYGLLHLQAESETDDNCKNIINDAASRIKSMMLLYDKLYRSEDFEKLSMKDYLEPLIREITDIFRSAVVIKTDFGIDDFSVKAEILTAVGIIINELITNSMKYAFSEAQNIIISLTSSKNDSIVTITYEDNGLGLPESISLDSTTGFGMQLIVMLVKQINGSIDIVRDGGTRFIIRFSI